VGVSRVQEEGKGERGEKFCLKRGKKSVPPASGEGKENGKEGELGPSCHQAGNGPRSSKKKRGRGVWDPIKKERRRGSMPILSSKKKKNRTMCEEEKKRGRKLWLVALEFNQRLEKDRRFLPWGRKKERKRIKPASRINYQGKKKKITNTHL